jgi:Protein of unknown function (DUF2924)
MQTGDPAAIEAEIEHIRSLGLEELRKRWRMTFGSLPPRALTKDLIARMIAYRLQEEAFGGLDKATIKLLDRLARGEKPELNRRLKPGTVLVREYRGERHRHRRVRRVRLAGYDLLQPLDDSSGHPRDCMERSSILRASRCPRPTQREGRHR